jgi:hypothetical protein
MAKSTITAAVSKNKLRMTPSRYVDMFALLTEN